MNDPLADFAADAAGLADALDALVASRRGAGHPHPATLDMPPMWPEHGLGGPDALASLASIALESAARLDHPGFLAHMDPPTPWFTWAATQWAASNNQNLLHPDVAPQMRELERTVIEWIAPSFGMSGGHLVPGSTVANLTALWAARDQRGVTEVVSSSAAHLSIAKAAHLLGLRHRVIDVGSDQRLEPAALGDVSRAAVVLTAGTVSAGAVDALQLAETDDRPAWVHVDAAWAGPLRFSPTHRSRLDGVEHADSVGFSAHKWLHQPKESAAVLFADSERANEALSFGGSYLSTPNIGLLGSTGARALPLAVTLLAWGRTGLAQVIEAGMARIDELAGLVAADDDFELWGPNQTGVVLWRPADLGLDRPLDLVAVQRQLGDAWVSLTEIDGQQWFRSVGANPLARPELVVERVRRAITAVRAS